MSAITTHPGSLVEGLQRCRRQQETWARLETHARLRPVRALRRLLVDRADSLCAAVADDIGKTAEETLGGEILPLADACRFLEREAGRRLRPHPVARRHRPLWLLGQRDVVYRRPRGIVAIIGTWNYPVFLNGVQLVQALTAGNGVVWKPSELGARSAAVLHALLQQAGFPGELVQLLDATREAGKELAQADVDHVCFTGAASTGRHLARTLGERLVSSTLELSGCDALFVLEDADVALAARAAWFGATVNRGQTCLASRRALVHRSVYTAFLDALKPLAAAAGPVSLATEKQMEQANRLVHGALAEGARLLIEPAAQERDGHAQLFPPTILIDARPDMALCREDSFAPLLAVLPFDTIEEALAADAQCHYGLGAAIFTRQPARAARLAAHLRVGAVTVNDVIAPTAHPATPFGGRGWSGWGVTQGAEGLLEMTVPQVVSVCPWSYRPHYDMAAGGDMTTNADMVRGLLEWSHAGTLRQRWHGLRRLAGSLWRKR